MVNFESLVVWATHDYFCGGFFLLKKTHIRCCSRVTERESVNSRPERRIRHTLFVFSRGQRFRAAETLALNRHGVRGSCLRLGIRLPLIKPRSHATLRRTPALIKPPARRPKRPQFDALRLSQRPVFLYLVEALADGGIVRVVDVDVGAGAWRGSLSLLITHPLIRAIKRHMHLRRMLHQYPTLQFMVLLLPRTQCILPRPRILQKSLLCVRGTALIPPTIDAICCAHERLSCSELRPTRTVKALDI